MEVTKKSYLFILLMVCLFFSGCETTGKAIDIAKTILPAYNEKRCIDSDGGISQDIVGSVSFMNEKKLDVCISRTILLEQYCSRNRSVNTEISCMYGCKAGACNLKNTKQQEKNLCPTIEGFEKDNNIHLIFVPHGFITAQEKELLQQEIKKLLHGDDQSLLFAEAFGLLDVDIIQKYNEFITINLVDGDFIAPESGGFVEPLLSFVNNKCAFFKEGRDVLVYLKNEAVEGGYCYAIPSLELYPKVIVAGHGCGITFIHEFGHAFAGLNEEYYLSQNYFPEEEFFEDQEEQIGYGAVNCDLHKTACSKWCKEIDAAAYQDYLNALEKEKNCRDILEVQDLEKWKILCPQMNFETIWSKEYVGKKCMDLSWYASSNMKQGVCSLTTMDTIKYVNLGKDCLPGYGCYFGCGGAVNAFRSAPYSVMGCGDIDDCNDAYGYSTQGIVVIDPLFPDTAPIYSTPAKEEIEKQFILLTTYAK